MPEDIATLLLEIFGGNPYYAVGKTNQHGVYYVPEYNSGLSADLIRQHLIGEISLGSYPVLQDNTVRWFGWDIDADGDMEAAREMTKHIVDRLNNIEHAVEYSGGKGYHVLVFLTEPIPASRARQIAEFVRNSENLSKDTRAKKPHVECYPKQDRLGGKETQSRKAVGNLLKIPLGQHPRTHEWSRFVDVDGGWEKGIDVDARLALSYRVRPEDLGFLINEPTEDKMEKLAEALASDWRDTQRHNLSLFLSGFLAQQNWTMDQAIELVDKICELTADPEKSNRIQAVRDTFRKYNNGETIAGFSQISDLLRSNTMNMLVRYSTELAAPDIAKKIEKIRFTPKTPTWKKEQMASDLVWSFLIDPELGRVLRAIRPDGNSYQAFWYSADTHLVISMESRAWDVHLFSQFRLNSSETFVKNVRNALLLRAEQEGQEVEIYRGSAWREGVLYVNLGGPEIWVVDGIQHPYSIYNGERGLFFRTSSRSTVPIPDFRSEPLDVWEFLVNDLNFTRSRAAPLDPEKQRELLKAWVLSTFFREELPTRPILALLGAPGSGKTTGIRRILRFLEGMDKNVLEVVEDKPDFWRAAIEEHRLLVLDNLEETLVKWLPKSLDQIATGSTITIRQLYETNRAYAIRSDVFVALTAVTMPFSKNTTFERMLTLEMEKLERYTPENVFNQKLRRNMDVLWADMLLKLTEIVSTLNRVKTATFAVNLRLADFATFCRRIESCTVVQGGLLQSGLSLLGSAQQSALAQSENSAFPIIQEWIEKNSAEAAKWHSSNELFAVLSEMAVKSKRPWPWKDSRGLSSHLRAIETVLVKELGCKVRQERDTSKGREVNLYSFPSDILYTTGDSPNGSKAAQSDTIGLERTGNS